MPHIARRTLLAGLGATGVTGLAAPLLAGSAEAAPTVSRVLARGLSIPWGLTFLPSGDALVTERATAQVHRISRRGGRRLVGTVRGVDRDAGEGGLLGAVVSPTFDQDRLVYLYLTTQEDNRVIAMRYAGGALSGRRLVLGGIPRGERSHNGGRLAFGPDGKLYVSTGDTQDRDQPQDTDALGGKILRLNADGSAPEDNPFGNLVWSYGHRNVQGLAWTSTGQMWATELGQNTRDELNQIVRGANYGWPEVEGGDGDGPYADPFVTWSPTSTCSPSGLAIIRNRAWVGALNGSSLYSVVLSGPNAARIRRHLHDDHGRIRTVEVAPDRSLWITTANGADDRILRITL